MINHSTSTMTNGVERAYLDGVFALGEVNVALLRLLKNAGLVLR
jgi:hypothetical protein